MANRDLKRLEERLKAIPRDVRQAIVPALAKGGEEMASTMRTIAPEDTGDLKDSIAVTLPGASTPPYSQPGGSTVAGELEVLVTAGGSDVRYAHLVEHGTAEAPAQPFFWPTVRSLQKRVLNRNKRAIRAAVRKHWGSA